MEGLFSGTWYRSAIKLGKITRNPTLPWKSEEDGIVPVPPFEPYNPFAWYYSASDIRQGEKSLYLEFLAVDADNTEEVVRFCQRFGVLGDADKMREWVEDKGPGPSVRIEPNVYYHPDSFEPLLSDDKRLNWLLWKPTTSHLPPEKLCPPQTIESFKAQQAVLRNALTPDPNIFSRSSSRLKDIKDITRTFTNNYLKDAQVQPLLNWNIQEHRWEIWWASYDLFGYFFIMLMLDLIGPGKVLSCPRCHKFFVTASQRTKYCSPKCYEVFKVQKYQREKRKKELAAQKGKKAKAMKSTGKKKGGT